jgi:hypothetical protein
MKEAKRLIREVESGLIAPNQWIQRQCAGMTLKIISAP